MSLTVHQIFSFPEIKSFLFSLGNSCINFSLSDKRKKCLCVNELNRFLICASGNVPNDDIHACAEISLSIYSLNVSCLNTDQIFNSFRVDS